MSEYTDYLYYLYVYGFKIEQSYYHLYYYVNIIGSDGRLCIQFSAYTVKVYFIIFPPNSNLIPFEQNPTLYDSEIYI